MTDLEAARRERDEARAEMRRLREDREAFALACVHTERERGREALAAATSRAEEAEERTREATRAWFAARRDAADLERRLNVLREVVPQMWGEALQRWPWLDCPGHEYDNRSTPENAAWLIGLLTSRLEGAEAGAAVLREALEKLCAGRRLGQNMTDVTVTKADVRRVLDATPAGRSLLAEVEALRAVEREARGAVRALGGPDHLREALATLDRLRKEGP